MTEDEAKKKWCPFARTVWGDGSMTDGAAFNRWTDADPDEPEKSVSRCFGSACMAWRWAGETEYRTPTRVHPVVVAQWTGWTVTNDTPDAKGYVEISPPPKGAPHGYCGLAGKP